MKVTYDYRVCMVQNGRVTFVNGKWDGSIGPEQGDTQKALDSCHQIWDYLNAAGRDGWDLTGAVNGTITHGKDVSGLTSYLFLKRPR